MDNGTDFFTDFKEILNDKNIGISKTIPYMPQSNSIVERANGVIKRIINKLIYNHMNEDYSKWSQFIDEAVNIYNNTKNVSTGKIPNNAILFQQKEDIDDVRESIKGKAIKPAPYQNSFKTYQRVRLRIPKSKLGNFDRDNWSNQEFSITRVIFPTRKEMEGEAAKPVRYRIHPINSNGNLIGKEQVHNYVRELLLAIPPLLGYQSMIPNIPGYVINEDDMNLCAHILPKCPYFAPNWKLFLYIQHGIVYENRAIFGHLGNIWAFKISFNIMSVNTYIR